VASPYTHQPVLLRESLAWLEARPDSVIVDGTLGGGGHAAAILERTGPGGRLIGLDRDAEALAAAAERLRPYGERVQLVHDSFRRLGAVLVELGVAAIDGVLLDLGVSSHQLDVAVRGFRFAADSADMAPLDMRMDRDAPVAAADLLRDASVESLETWFRSYGELRGARRLHRSSLRATCSR
jgi:16S rRNA (cytosine1402-N4)-methyltransferase